MADVTANTTFRRSVMGKHRVFICDIPGGGTTADLIVINAPLRMAFSNFRGSTAGSSSLPVPTIDGTTVTINQLAATTGAAYTVTVFAGR